MGRFRLGTFGRAYWVDCQSCGVGLHANAETCREFEPMARAASWSKQRVGWTCAGCKVRAQPLGVHNCLRIWDKSRHNTWVYVRDATREQRSLFD